MNTGDILEGSGILWTLLLLYPNIAGLIIAVSIVTVVQYHIDINIAIRSIKNITCLISKYEDFFI